MTLFAPEDDLWAQASDAHQRWLDLCHLNARVGSYEREVSEAHQLWLDASSRASEAERRPR